MKKLLLLCAVFAASQFAFAEEDPVQAIMKELKHPDPKVRAAMARKIGAAGFDMIVRILADKSPEVIAVQSELKEFLATATTPSFHEKKLQEAGPEQAVIHVHEELAVNDCRAYAEAQSAYRRSDRDKDDVLEYAPSLQALYETAPGAADIKLIDLALKNAESSAEKAAPKFGYYFKVLTKQGKDAAGREMNYMKDGNMVLGYALLAYPAEFGVSGKNSFVISRTGVVYKKDLGAATKAVAEKMIEYNPDYSWDVVPENKTRKREANTATPPLTEAEMKKRIERMPDGDTRIVQYMAAEKIPAYTKLTDAMFMPGIGLREKVVNDQSILFKKEQLWYRVTLCDIEPGQPFKEGVNIAAKGKPASPLAAVPDGWGVVELFRDDIDSKAEYIRLGDFIALLANENGKTIWVTKQAKVLLPTKLSEDDAGRTVILLAMKPEEIPVLKRLKGKTKLTVVGVPGRAPLKVEDKF